MGVSTTDPMEWMLKDGSGKSTVYKGKGGWYRKYADGRIELIQSMNFGNVSDTVPVDPKIASVQNPADGEYFISDNDVLILKVNFDEAVKVTGAPRVTFDITLESDGSVVTKDLAYDSAASSSTQLVFSYTPVTGDAGTVSNVGGTNREITLDANVFIQAVDDGSNADVKFPTGYTDPAITIKEAHITAVKKPAKKAATKK